MFWENILSQQSLEQLLATLGFEPISPFFVHKCEITSY